MLNLHLTCIDINLFVCKSHTRTSGVLWVISMYSDSYPWTLIHIHGLWFISMYSDSYPCTLIHIHVLWFISTIHISLTIAHIYSWSYIVNIYTCSKHYHDHVCTWHVSFDVLPSPSVLHTMLSLTDSGLLIADSIIVLHAALVGIVILASRRTADGGPPYAAVMRTLSYQLCGRIYIGQWSVVTYWELCSILPNLYNVIKDVPVLRMLVINHTKTHRY